MICIIRVPADILQEHEEDWDSPDDIFESIEVVGPFPDRKTAVREARSFDDGTWAWRIADTSDNKT